MRKVQCRLSLRLCGRHEGGRRSKETQRAGKPAGRTRELSPNVKAIFERHEGRYGHRRVHEILRRQGRQCSVELVRQLMAQAGLRAAQPRKWQVTTCPDKRAAALVPDLVRRDFTAEVAGAKLVADITYVHTWQDWVYLATVIDCYSRAVVGWAVADHMRTELVVDAIEMTARPARLHRVAARTLAPDCGRTALGNGWTRRSAAAPRSSGFPNRAAIIGLVLAERVG
jgi:transposase InsO family protein